jgi:hypothetical protein
MSFKLPTDSESCLRQNAKFETIVIMFCLPKY